jgi:RNA-binding protein YlmH
MLALGMSLMLSLTMVFLSLDAEVVILNIYVSGKFVKISHKVVVAAVLHYGLLM